MKILHETETLSYEIFNLNSLNPLANLVGKAFINSDPMAIAQQLSLEEFADYIKLLGEWAEKQKLTIIAKDKLTDEVVGAVLAGDFASDSPLTPENSEHISNKFEPIVELIESLETQYKYGKQIRTGEHLHIYMLAVQQYKSLLFAIAYRMLGSITEAEDALQETWIRWQNSSALVQSPKAFLSSITTRLCIDRLRYLHREREKYIGIWLPEPLITQQDNSELFESVSYAFLVLIECLSPTERAIFILREVFDYEYAEVSLIVNKSISNCLQIFYRSRKKIINHKSELNLSSRELNLIIEQFLIAWNQGDLDKLISLMTEDINFYADGGGKVTAAQKPIYGNVKVTQFLLAIKRSDLIPKFSSKLVFVNNKLGILNFIEQKPQSVFSFDFGNRKIGTIFAVVNPDKLRLPNLIC